MALDTDKNLVLTESELDYVRNLVYEKSAIVIEPEKSYLVEARLAPIVRRKNLESISNLVAVLQNGSSTDPLRKAVVEAMTTNETSFFRDLHPFESLKKTVIPDLIKRRAEERTLSFWCAASSSGQEPYTICMMLRENFPELSSWNIEFVASDLSTDILERAQEGTYTKLEVNRGLPAPLLVKYFQKSGEEWQLKESIREMITFKQVNLIERWPMMQPLDIVFIRNVLIYFDVDTKRQILGNIRKRMQKGAYLYLGNAETTLNIDANFERTQSDKATYYRLREE
jgi:chemotaxis protein methyltransferase CheR